MTVANWIEPTATDNSGNLPIIIKSHEPGTSFAEGNTTVSYIAIDDAGNQADCSFVVFVTLGRSSGIIVNILKILITICSNFFLTVMLQHGN